MEAVNIYSFQNWHTLADFGFVKASKVTSYLRVDFFTSLLVTSLSSE